MPPRFITKNKYFLRVFNFHQPCKSITIGVKYEID
jgi:hypothetical protein